MDLRMRRPVAVVGVIAVGVALAAVVLTAVLWRRSPPVAVLEQALGTVERDTARRVGDFRPAKVRAEFFVGDGVRSGARSRAALGLADGSRLALAERSLVRFLEGRSRSGARRFDVEVGEVTLQAGRAPLTIETDVGLAVLDAQSVLAIRRTDEGLRYEVSVGMARFDTPDGQTTVGPGQSIVVGIGGARVETAAAPASAAPSAAPAPTPSAAPADADADGTVTARVAGPGASVRAPGQTAFAALAQGETTIAAGSTLRLANGTTSEVERNGEHAVLVGAGSFVVAEKGRPFIQAQGGGVNFTNAERQVEVAVPGGSIVVEIGATADLRVRADATRVAVKAGVVELRSASGAETLQAGEEGVLGAKGISGLVGRGPGYVDFAAHPGESFSVHDPSPPTAVGFPVADECPEGAVVQLVGESRARGTGTVSILVPAGTHKYELHCIGAGGVQKDAFARGTVTVMRDAGRARIPRTAPETLVDADGRRYTVLYQNLLPKISVRWPGATQGPSYTLHVTSPGGKAESHESPSPQWTFQSGELGEGVHELTFEAAGVGRSKATTVDIRFDNAAPTATLTSPANGSVTPGQTVHVAGVALEGWKISVDGKELSMDSQHRFEGDVAASPDERALAVEFVHPRRGIHFYLRRSAGH